MAKGTISYGRSNAGTGESVSLGVTCTGLCLFAFKVDAQCAFPSEDGDVRSRSRMVFRRADTFRSYRLAATSQKWDGVSIRVPARAQWRVGSAPSIRTSESRFSEA